MKWNTCATLFIVSTFALGLCSFFFEGPELVALMALIGTVFWTIYTIRWFSNHLK